MRSRPKLLVVLVIILGLATGYLVYMYLTQTSAPGENPATLTSQVVARLPIKAGTKITSELLEVKKIPEEFAHPDAFTDRTAVVGMFAVSDMVPGEVVLAGKVSSENMADELPYKIPDGYRAIAVPVDPLTGVASQVKPGHRVDVLAVYRTGDEDTDYRVHTILQRVLVLASGLKLQKAEGPMEVDTVTLAVTPHEAEVVVYAMAAGEVTLTLRPVADNSQFTLESMHLSRLQTLYP